MKFAIRDDDTSYLTNPNELEAAYDFIENGCVSLSVVPNTVPYHRNDVFPYGKNIEYKFYDICNNVELVDYLKDGVESGKYDILLHGYTHEYKKINQQWTPEMLWKTQSQLKEEILLGKSCLEEVFGFRITVFVAPNNAIDKNAIGVIEELGMDFSGIIFHFDRKFNFKYLRNYFRRWIYRIVKGIPYAGILDYGKHKELVAYTLDDFERLKKEYLACKDKGQPFVVYTHYWQLNTNPKIKALLKKIYEFAIDDGAELVPLSECFKS